MLLCASFCFVLWRERIGGIANFSNEIVTKDHPIISVSNMYFFHSKFVDK